MKSNDLQAAMAAFLENNPDIEPGTEPTESEKERNNKNIVLRVSIDRKGRNGKTATIVEGLDEVDSNEVDRLAKAIKKQLGVGGSFRGGEILIQGSYVDKVKQILTAQGFKVR